MGSFLGKVRQRRKWLVDSGKRHRVRRPVVAKTRSERAEDLIKYAEDLIRGTRVIIREKRLGRPLTKALRVHDKINSALLADAHRTNRAIAASILDANEGHVARRRKVLVENGIIDDVPPGKRIATSQRKPEKITGHLNEKKRKALVEKNRRRIQDKALNLLGKHNSAFKRLKMGQLKIARELKERMDWPLQTWPGPETISVQRFFNDSLAKAAYELGITADRQAKRIEKSMPGSGRRRKGPDVEKRLMKIEWDCKQMGLNPLQKAVYYGKEAKMTGKRIGIELGYSKNSAESRISQIRKVVDKKEAELLARREALKM